MNDDNISGLNNITFTDVNGAIAIFRRAKELEPTLDLDPEAEARKLASEAPLRD